MLILHNSNYFIQQTFFGYLQCTKLSSRLQWFRNDWDKGNPCSNGASILMGEIDNIQTDM